MPEVSEISSFISNKMIDKYATYLILNKIEITSGRGI